MAWTSPRTWVVGEVLTAALLNTHVRDNLKSLHRIAVAKKAAFAASSYNYVTAFVPSRDDFEAEFGTGYGWGTTGDPFIAPEAGVYEVEAWATWTGATGTGSAGIRIDHMNSGGTLIDIIGIDDTSQLNGNCTTSALVVLAVGEEIRLAAFNFASGTQGTLAIRATVAQRG